MKSWKTTLAGCLAALGGYLGTQSDPAWLASAGKILCLISTAALGICARDHTPDPPAGTGGGWKPKIKLLVFIPLVFCLGCASVKVEIVETKDGAKQTTIRARTFFDAKSELAKLRTSATDKTQTVNLSGLNQESSGTNVVEIIDRAVSAAVSAGIKAAKPIP